MVALDTTEEVGVYSVALRAYVVITMIPLNIGLTLFPYYGERYGREELEAVIFHPSRSSSRERC